MAVTVEVSRSLNITLNSESVTYSQFTYPAGETQVRIRPDWTRMVDESDHVSITARIRNAQDIISLALLNNAIGEKRYRQLYLPYLPYSRADRKFCHGDCCGLEVFGDLIGSMRFDDIVSLDVHNHDKAQLYIPHLIDASPASMIRQSVVDFARLNYSRRVTVLFPDEGASVRYRYIPDRYGSNHEIIDIDRVYCSKERDEKTGEILSVAIPPLPREQPVIIVDDICDGGRTFLNVAAQISSEFHLGLYVTHGIFSRGLSELFKFFSRIYTTDSICDIDSPSLTIWKSLPAMNPE